MQAPLPRRRHGQRPICEVTMPAGYIHRAYRVRDLMHLHISPQGDTVEVGHVDGGYCLDRTDPATGSHVAEDYAYRPDYSKPFYCPR